MIVCDRRYKLTLGLLVEIPEVLPLLLVDDGQDSGNGLSDSVAVDVSWMDNHVSWIQVWV